MRRSIVPAVVLFVVAAIFLCPVSEMFDRWDHTARTGKDTESAVMLAAECVGAALAVIQAAAHLAPGFAPGSPVRVPVAGCPREFSPAFIAFLFPESPPALPLRI